MTNLDIKKMRDYGKGKWSDFSYLPLNQAYSVAQVFSHNKPYFHQPKKGKYHENIKPPLLAWVKETWWQKVTIGHDHRWVVQNTINLTQE